MRIVAIHVEGYGTLGDRSLHLDRPFVLVYGPNEAGKSTLTSFIRTVLFGFMTRGQAEHRIAERYEPLGGGTYGGSLILIDEKDQRILVERFDRTLNSKGRSSTGTVKVTFPDGSVGGEEELSLILGGISSELFRVLFAFGLTELQELRTLQKDEIGSYLYSAGLGISPSVMIDGERKLTARIERLYKPRGKNQEINMKLKSLDDVDIAIRRSKDFITQYDAMKNEERAADIHIQELEQLRTGLNKQSVWLETCLKARDSWFRLQSVQAELAELPDLPAFPEQVVSRYESLLEEQERLIIDSQECKLKLEQLDHFLDQLMLNDQMLLHKTEIESLLEGVSIYQADLRTLDELKVEYAQTNKELQRTLRLVDAKWDEHHLESFPVSAANREEVSRFKQQMDDLLRERNLLDTEEHTLINQRDRLNEEHKMLAERKSEEASVGAGMQLTALVDKIGDKIGEPTSYIRTLANQYASYKLLDQECEHLRQRVEDHHLQQALTDQLAHKKDSNSSLTIPISVGLIGAIGAALLFTQGNATYGAILLGAGVILALGIAVVMRKSTAGSHQAKGRRGREYRGSQEEHTPMGQSSVLTDKLTRVERERDELRDRLQDQVYLFWQLRSADSGKVEYAWVYAKRWLDEQLEPWQTAIEERSKQQDKWALLGEKTADLQQQLFAVDKQLEKLEARIQTNTYASADVGTRWSEWLTRHAFSEPLSPYAVEASLPLVEQGHSLLHQQRRLEGRLAAAEITTASFEAAAAGLLGSSAAAEPILGVKRQGEALAQELRKREEAARAMEERAAVELTALSLSQRLDSLQLRMAELLEQAHAESETSLRVNARLAARRAELDGERRHLLPALTALVHGQRLQELDAMLTEHGESELALQADELTQRLAQVTREVNELRERRGLLAGEAAKLELGTSHSDKLQQREEQLASLQQAGRDYAVHAFALHLLRKAREVYEQERQPGVLKRASDYFARMTQYKFTGIRAPFASEQKLEAVRPDGRGVDTAYLSRGTAEQLYLAMRFALAEEYATRVNLPLIMDDILVNFDDARMETCLEVLNELSTRHQIILFTCHKHVREATLRKLPNLQLVEL